MKIMTKISILETLSILDIQNEKLSIFRKNVHFGIWTDLDKLYIVGIFNCNLQYLVTPTLENPQ